jgi:hypothetical protein
MKRSTRLFRILAAFTLLNAGMALQAAGPPDTTEDGLKLVKVKGIELAYKREGATLATYKRIILDPTDVAFSKDFNPERPGSHIKISQRERDDIRAGLAKLFNETFAAEMKKGGIDVVTEPAPDVLRVTAKLVDVYVNAPDVASASRGRTYVMNAGKMTLVIELKDSETGAVLARAADRAKAREQMQMTWADKSWNADEARGMITAWAKILRERFEAMRKS